MGNKQLRTTKKRKNRGGERLKEWKILKSYSLYPNVQTRNFPIEAIASATQPGNSVQEISNDVADQCHGSESLIQTDCTDDSGHPTEYVISGRRIVDLNYFINRIKYISEHAPQFNCSIVNMKLQNEIKRGLKSGLVFKCNMCGIVKTIWTEPEETTSMDINSAAVAGAISSGGGFTSTEKLLGAMNVRYPSFKTFQKHSQTVSKGWEESALQEMKASAEEECRMARERGDVDHSGNALLTVVADGSWAKRSYRTNYNSLSGMVSYCILYVGYPTSLYCTEYMTAKT